MVFRPLYRALVRPILEYGKQASSPYLRRDIALRELPYEDRLRRLTGIAGFAATSSWPTKCSTVALTCNRRNFSRRQWSETFEDTTDVRIELPRQAQQ